MNDIINYAYDRGGLDFLLTIAAENGTHEINRASPINSNGYRDIGLCQLNRKWHHQFIDSPEFQDYRIQIDYCYEVYEKAMNSGRIKTTFYGYNRRHAVEHLYECN